MSASDRMRENWDRRAERDAFYYVETAHGSWAGWTIRELREDPTHDPGTRAFVVASPTSSS